MSEGTQSERGSHRARIGFNAIKIVGGGEAGLLKKSLAAQAVAFYHFLHMCHDIEGSSIRHMASRLITSLHQTLTAHDT